MPEQSVSAIPVVATPKYHFICGLPSSGSTLRAALLLQNPRFHAGMTSPLGTLFRTMFNQLGAGSEFGSLVSTEQRRRLPRSLFDSYYADQADKAIIFGTNRMWTANMPVLMDQFPGGQAAKLIACVCNVARVFGSEPALRNEMRRRQANMMSNTALIQTSLSILLGAALAACGGGGSEVAVTTPTTPAATLANAQGFWSADGGNASAVILPDGQVWVVYQTGTTVTALAQASLSLSGSAYTSSGRHYSLPAGAVQTFSFSGTLGSSAASTLSTSVTIGAGSATAQTWSYNKAYETPATQASVQGHWSGKQGADSLVWDIDAAGKLVGTSSTGCVYSGTIAPNASPVAVFDAVVIENCAGTGKTISGIATLSATKTSLSLAYTASAGVQGGVLVVAK